jgi:hypothetical protein
MYFKTMGQNFHSSSPFIIISFSACNFHRVEVRMVSLTPAYEKPEFLHKDILLKLYIRLMKSLTNLIHFQIFSRFAKRGELMLCWIV